MAMLASKHWTKLSPDWFTFGIYVVGKFGEKEIIKQLFGRPCVSLPFCFVQSQSDRSRLPNEPIYLQS